MFLLQKCDYHELMAAGAITNFQSFNSQEATLINVRMERIYMDQVYY